MTEGGLQQLLNVLSCTFQLIGIRSSAFRRSQCTESSTRRCSNQRSFLVAEDVGKERRWSNAFKIPFFIPQITWSFILLSSPSISLFPFFFIVYALHDPLLLLIRLIQITSLYTVSPIFLSGSGVSHIPFWFTKLSFKFHCKNFPIQSCYTDLGTIFLELIRRDRSKILMLVGRGCDLLYIVYTWFELKNSEFQ